MVRSNPRGIFRPRHLTEPALRGDEPSKALLIVARATTGCSTRPTRRGNQPLVRVPQAGEVRDAAVFDHATPIVDFGAVVVIVSSARLVDGWCACASRYRSSCRLGATRRFSVFSGAALGVYAAAGVRGRRGDLAPPRAPLDLIGFVIGNSSASGCSMRPRVPTHQALRLMNGRQPSEVDGQATSSSMGSMESVSGRASIAAVCRSSMPSSSSPKVRFQQGTQATRPVFANVVWPGTGVRSFAP